MFSTYLMIYEKLPPLSNCRTCYGLPTAGLVQPNQLHVPVACTAVLAFPPLWILMLRMLMYQFESNVSCTIWWNVNEIYIYSLQHSVAVNSGFRNSGLTVGKMGKIITVSLEQNYGLMNMENCENIFPQYWDCNLICDYFMCLMYFSTDKHEIICFF